MNLLLQVYDEYIPSSGISETTIIISSLILFLGFFISIVIVIGIAKEKRIDVFLLCLFCTPIAGLLYIIACNMNNKSAADNENISSQALNEEEEREDWQISLDETLGVKNKI